MAPVPGSGCGNRRTTSPKALFVNAIFSVVTGLLPVFCTNCERNTKKSLNFPIVPSISALRPASPADWNSLNRSICRHVERSEEHTSELQSLRHLVCRLLLEKKQK